MRAQKLHATASAAGKVSTGPDPDRHAHGRTHCPGVLLVNVGTPDAPTPAALRRYLREFLSDRRVVELPRWTWWPLLYGVILPLRAPRSAKLYRSVWREDGSPLLVYSQRLVRRLEEKLRADTGLHLAAALGMRYGQPSVREALGQLREAGADRFVVLPLYPQYAASTTASAFDAVSAAMRHWRRVPPMRFVSDYAAFTPWLHAVAESVRDFRERRGGAERLLFSFHGIPRRQFEAGDPYYCQCRRSARLIAGRLGLEDGEWALSFQSRFGPAEWLRPYTMETLEHWAKRGVRQVQVVCPGFAVDCLETLEEIAVQNRQAFERAGGERLEYIPALNDRPMHAAALASLVRREAGDWLDPAQGPYADARGEAAERARRAREQAARYGELPE